VKRATQLILLVAALWAVALPAAARVAQEPAPPAAATAAPPAEGGQAAPAVEGTQPVQAASPTDAAHAAPAGGPAESGHHVAGREGGHAATGEGGGEGEAEHAESPWATVARLFNFALLAGALVFLLRSPFGAFLDSRKVQIRKSLTDAAATREDATRQLVAIDEKLKALPGELDALKRRGTEEIAAEEERIRQASDAERARMLENARLEIGRRAHVAERRLHRRAGELAVDVATDRVKRTITDADQRRLLDKYLEQVGPETLGS
jgi:F0F1-type ATP synthase membrane subunit b/b'